MLVRYLTLALVFVFATSQIPESVVQNPRNATLSEEEAEDECIFRRFTSVTLSKGLLIPEEWTGQIDLLTSNGERFAAFNADYPGLGMGERSFSVDIKIIAMSRVDDELQISVTVDVMFGSKGGVGIARKRGELWEMKEGKLHMTKGDKWSGYMIL